MGSRCLRRAPRVSFCWTIASELSRLEMALLAHIRRSPS
jgi:hypothetical protein